MNSKLRAMLAAVVIAVAGLMLSAAVAFANITSWDVNQCSQLNLQNPHISSDPRWGVLVKSQWECDLWPATVHLDTAYTGAWLWVCPSTGPDDENWITSNCTYKGGCFAPVNFPFNGGNIGTLWFPCNGAHTSGTGYWVACTQWYSSGPNGNGQYFLTFSNYIWINAP